MSQGKEAIVKSPSGRVRRTPVGLRNKLTVQGKDANFEYRFVNDKDSRIAEFQDAGWELVDATDVKVGDRRVDTASSEGSKTQIPVGNDTKAFLMRIKKEWYQEDQAAKQEHVNQVEQGMYRDARALSDYGFEGKNTSGLGRHKD